MQNEPGHMQAAAFSDTGGDLHLFPSFKKPNNFFFYIVINFQ